jgi:two-component system cell cycle sensor histidine kinase/response regulator CckA
VDPLLPDEPELDALLEQLPFFVALIDEQLRYRWGHRPSGGDVAGQQLGDFLRPEHRVSVRAAAQKALASGEVQRCEVLGGYYCDEEWHGVRLIPVRSGGERRLLVVAAEISGEQGDRDALAASEARFRLLTEQFPDTIHIIDDERRIHYASDGKTGAERERTRTVDQLTHPDDLLKAVACIAAVFETGELLEYRARFAEAPGMMFSCRAARLPPEHGERRCLLIIRDITAELEAMAERERLGEFIQRAQRLKSTGQLTGGIAHDFNNLLTIIFAELEQARALARGEGKLLEALDNIQDVAEQAAGLTSKLLAFSGHAMLSRGPVEVGVLLRAVASMLRPTLTEQVQLDLVLPEAAWIEGDVRLLEQALINLALNARDAIGEQTGTITLSAHRQGARVMLVVEDSGCGMSTQTRERIFEPYFTTKSPGKGTGLGLAVAYGIAAQHGAQLRVDSVLGRGSRFTLPLVQIPSPVASPARDPQAQGGALLLVEDEVYVRDALAKILSRSGFEVTTAADGLEAVARAREQRFDAVVLDMGLPGMSGAEVFASLQQHEPGQPTVFVTGYDPGELSMPALQQPHVRMLQKPYRRQALMTALAEVLAVAAGRSSR